MNDDFEAMWAAFDGMAPIVIRAEQVGPRRWVGGWRACPDRPGWWGRIERVGLSLFLRMVDVDHRPADAVRPLVAAGR